MGHQSEHWILNLVLIKQFKILSNTYHISLTPHHGIGFGQSSHLSLGFLRYWLSSSKSSRFSGRGCDKRGSEFPFFFNLFLIWDSIHTSVDGKSRICISLG